MARTARVLAAATIALAISACGSPSAEAPADARRLAASRPSESDRLAGVSEDRLRAALSDIVFDLIRWNAPPPSRDRIAARVAEALAAAGLVDEERRARETDVMREVLFDLHVRLNPRPDPSPPAEGAVVDAARIEDFDGAKRRCAGHMAWQLVARFPMSSPHPRPQPRRLDAEDVEAPNAAEDRRRVSWRTLSGFPYEAGRALPDDVLRIDGRSATVRGFLDLQHLEHEGMALLLEGFPWSSSCAPQPQSPLDVVVIPAAGADWMRRLRGPVIVTGRMEVGEQVEDGRVESVYRLRIDGPEAVRPVD
ncbi:MAG TPA: hypothetical protein VEI02_13910 [Planctomycetota bacterium]|nr:hypothetical protein [Planctomycetota bacterium]